ncbi:transcriptional regulator GcvA [Azohydromonas aeria]|uniref:transcriptional regulator GcvA n=1 Tax=Azohydromonas aeria TaxID=2590212 RepID=UPI0012F86635|nr:transcriptional regulator GcvA [Azohydromonas aeria]
MAHALPPLAALRAFEAVARHANITRAADELHVTPGALSHQVRGLEELLGCRLFERRARGVALTPQGQALFPGLRSGFGQIREAVEALRALDGQQVLVLSAPPGFTSKWLAPRLYRFAEAHPRIELRVASSAAYANFGSDGVDAAIRNVPDGRPREAGLVYEKLADVSLVPVCSPRLLAGAKGAPARQRLRRLPRIHDDQLAGRPEMPGWDELWRAAGLAPDVAPVPGMHFSSADHAIDAAVQGAGVLLAHSMLVDDEVRGGRLVRALDVVLPVARSYHFVCPARKRALPAVAAFRDWLAAEMARGAGAP